MAMLLAAQWILSSVIIGANYYGFDGKMAQSVALTAFKFAGYFDVTNLNPIQGVGSQLLPKNVWANPSLWPFASFDKELATDVSALIALGCFASAVYIMMRCFDAPVLLSALAAQSCIVLFAPALLLLHMPTNFCLTPADAVVYAPYMIALGLLARLQPGSWRSWGVKAAGISALVLYSIYCDPLFTMIPATGWAAAFATVTLSPLHLRTILLRAAALGCCFAVLLLSGAAEYLYTLAQYTSRVQYAYAFDRPREAAYVSAMIYSPNMRYFYLACMLGWLIGLVTLRGRLRALPLAAAVSFAVWILFSVVFLLLNAPWIAPIPIYLEHSLFPLYLAAAFIGYWGILRATALLIARGAAALVGRAGALRLRPVPMPLSAQSAAAGRAWEPFIPCFAAVSFLAVAIIPAKVVTYALTDGRAYARMVYYPWSNEPELIEFLTKNIGLAAGHPFRGALEFVTPSAFTIATLWSHGIPTLHEHGQLITPVSWYFTLKFVNPDARSAYWNVLPLLGMRYAAILRPLPDHLAVGLSLTTTPHRPEAVADKTPGTWHVYELPHPNIGDYSPVEVVTASSGAAMTAALTKADFDFTRQVVVAAPIQTLLVPARDMRFSIVRGGLHVSGKSDGTSLVVLPQQFSHCLRARDPGVRFVRANLLLTGMIFSGEVDTDISFDYGLFSPACRYADLRDFKQLDLRIDLRVPHLQGDRWFPDWDHAVAKLQKAANAIF